MLCSTLSLAQSHCCQGQIAINFECWEHKMRFKFCNVNYHINYSMLNKRFCTRSRHLYEVEKFTKLNMQIHVDNLLFLFGFGYRSIVQISFDFDACSCFLFVCNELANKTSQASLFFENFNKLSGWINTPSWWVCWFNLSCELVSNDLLSSEFL